MDIEANIDEVDYHVGEVLEMNMIIVFEVNLIKNLDY
jgi:hypothetical protein